MPIYKQIKGIVEHGAKLGRELGFPTANIKLNDFQGVKGVYLCRAIICNFNYWGIVNIGTKPTISNQESIIGAEVFFMDYNGANLYGKEITLELHNFIRAEKKFSSLEELKKKIANDEKIARELIPLQSI